MRKVSELPRFKVS